MIFSAATFLYLLPLAALPIIFHLVLKQKKRTEVFSTLMFFLRADPKLNSRRKIRHWLLLLMRVFLLALLLLALSRPAMQIAGGAAGKTSVVVLVDNSGSMSAESATADMTQLECAIEGARQLILSLKDTADAAVVLLVEDHMVEVPDSLTTDRDLLLACLGQVRQTHATGQVRRALARACELLKSSSARGGAVHVFSDLQQAEWGASARPLDIRADSVTVFVHKIEAGPIRRGNVAIAGVELPQERVLPGQPYAIGLALRNNSTVQAQIRVNSTDSQGRTGTQDVTLDANRSETVTLQITAAEPGIQWINAWIEGDGFSADNHAGVGVVCDETVPVYLDGSDRSFGLLPFVLSPSGSGQYTGMTCESFATGVSQSRLLSGRPILVVTTWGRSYGAAAEMLRPYVEDGGNVLIVPSASGSTVAPAGAGWHGAQIGTRRMHATGLRLRTMSPQAEFWTGIGGEADSDSIPLAAYVLAPLRLSGDFTPLLGADSDQIALAHRKLGKGNVYVSGVAFSPRWSTLPLTSLWVVMAQRMALLGSAAQDPSGLSFVAGDRPQAIQALGSDLEILSLAGDPMDWKGRATEVPVFPRAGVYLMKAGENKKAICVRCSGDQGERRFVESPDVPAVGSLSHTVVPYESETDYEQLLLQQARAVEMYTPLLLLAMLVLLAEGLLGAPREYAVRRGPVESSGPHSVPVGAVGRLVSLLHRSKTRGRESAPDAAMEESAR